MDWTIINKKETNRPVKVIDYKAYKPFLRDEANKKCVYCAIDENPGGGYDHFHVEHYRPKSLDQFKDLINDYDNLFYSCAVCNRFKSNDWPREPLNDHSVASYPNPNETNYNDLFELQENGLLKGKFVASKYIIGTINLNRVQLINERREVFIRKKSIKLIKKVDEMREKLMQLSDSEEKNKIISQLLSIITKTSMLLHEEREIPRYEPTDIKRVKAK